MVALPEQSPGQLTIDDALAEIPEAPPQRQILVIPGEFLVADTYVETQGGEFGELAYATPVHAASVFLTRAQLITVGSAMLQLAGKMTPPKIVKEQEEAKASDLAVVVRDTTLIDPAGKPLTSADLRV